MVALSGACASEPEVVEPPTTPPVLTTLYPPLTTTTLAPPPPRRCVYTVQPEDTLNGIANTINDIDVTVAALMEENGIEDPTRLRIGEQLVIPPSDYCNNYLR